MLVVVHLNMLMFLLVQAQKLLKFVSILEICSKKEELANRIIPLGNIPQKYTWFRLRVTELPPNKWLQQ